MQMAYLFLICSTFSFMYSQGYTNDFSRPLFSLSPCSNWSHQKISSHSVVDQTTRLEKIEANSAHTDSSILSTEDLKEAVSIEALLTYPEQFHRKTVTVRGMVTQPEMHLDDTKLFFDFVFVLKKGEYSIVVFGQHDRTQGNSPIAMGHTVQVTGIFWKDRIAHDYHFTNNLEAITITPYPSLIPDRT